MNYVSAGHIILTPSQPVGSGCPWVSNPQPCDQETHALPTEPGDTGRLGYRLASLILCRATLVSAFSEIIIAFLSLSAIITEIESERKQLLLLAVHNSMVTPTDLAAIENAGVETQL